MIARRTLLTTTAAMAGMAALAWLLPAPLRAAYAAAGGESAAAFVRQTADRLTAIVNGPGSIADKRREMQGVIDSAVDVDGVGAFCLGRFWRTATPEQQKTYLTLFHDVLLTNITGKLGEYNGVQVTVGRATPAGDTTRVATTVDRPNNPPTQVEWVVSTAAGSPKVVDVIAEGTSLRLTQRSDYASFLSQHGNSVQALINALQQQIAQNG
jgi:phospholipid transport system substrate-binding protein